MPVPSSMSDLAVNAANCNPPGGETIGTLGDDYHRALQAIVRRESAKGADLAIVGGVLTPGNDGNHFVVTTVGASLTGIANTWVGREITLVFSGATTIVHSSNLILLGGANITTRPGGICHFVQEAATPVWRCVSSLGNVDALPAVGLISRQVTAGTNSLFFVLTPAEAAVYRVIRFRIEPGFVMTSTLAIRFSSNFGASFEVGLASYQSRRVQELYTSPTDSPINLTGPHIAISSSSFGPENLCGEVDVYLAVGLLRSSILQNSGATQTVGRSVAQANVNAFTFVSLGSNFVGTISMFGLI